MDININYPSYIVITDCNKQLFEKKINELVSNGYSLQGGVSVIQKENNRKLYNNYNSEMHNEGYYDDSIIFFQALIKN
jgi:hypothetical protein